MAEEDAIANALNLIKLNYRSAARRDFLDDIAGQIEDSDEITELLLARTQEPRMVAVSADRRWNDKNFSYHYFDTLLLVLAALSGSAAIYKPASQLRVLQWYGKRSALITILRYFAKLNAKVNFKRALILPYPMPAVGHRLDQSPYLK